MTIHGWKTKFSEIRKEFGYTETEDLISDETKASIRCLPFDGDLTPGVCVKTGNPSARRVLFAKSY